MKSCIDFYDDSAQAWADEWYKNETLLPYLKRFLVLVNKSEPRILDLCCGAGYESMRLEKLGAKVVGVDLSENSLKIAKDKNPDIDFYLKDMLVPYDDLGIFDGIACIAGIVHLQKEQLKVAFENMAKVLVEGGYLLLVFKHGTGEKETSEFNNQVYKRNFVYHIKEELDCYTKEYFDFIEEIPSRDDWKYFIYRKKTQIKI